MLLSRALMADSSRRRRRSISLMEPCERTNAVTKTFSSALNRATAEVPASLDLVSDRPVERGSTRSRGPG